MKAAKAVIGRQAVGVGGSRRIGHGPRSRAESRCAAAVRSPHPRPPVLSDRRRRGRLVFSIWFQYSVLRTRRRPAERIRSACLLVEAMHADAQGGARVPPPRSRRRWSIGRVPSAVRPFPGPPGWFGSPSPFAPSPWHEDVRARRRGGRAVSRAVANRCGMMVKVTGWKWWWAGGGG